MKKRLLKSAVAAALTMAFTVPAFANPFSDVPANHWAYDAVNKLVKAGIVDGYADGTFKGDKTMTRYEMAQIVAKAMNKSLNADQKAVVDQLAQEFSTEINGLQKQIDNMVKVSGDARVRYFDTENGSSLTDYRARVNFDGKINDNYKFNARLSSGNVNADSGSANLTLNTANVSFKALGMANTIGRQDIKLGSGVLMDTQMNGIASKMGSLKLFAGNLNDSGVQRIYGAELGTNILGAKVNFDYLENTTADKTVYGANTSFNLMDGVTLNADYIKNQDDKATATAYGVKFNKLGLSATYRDVEAGAVYGAFSTMVSGNLSAADINAGFKGMEYEYNKDLAKNTSLSVKYQDFEKQDGTKMDARTSATVSVKF